MEPQVVVFWFRRDLRINDNAGLYAALNSGYRVLPIFVFDPDILDPLEDRDDPRVTFIYENLESLNEKLLTVESGLMVIHAKPQDAFQELSRDFNLKAVYTNTDYEPYAIKRDEQIRNYLNAKGISFFSFKDQVIFEKDEVVKPDRTPYTIYTPYSRKWKQQLNEKRLSVFDSEKMSANFINLPPREIPSLRSLGFRRSNLEVKTVDLSTEMLSSYDQLRNVPSKDATSHLSVHLRFGTISVREVVKKALPYESFLNELIWREFFMQILYHYPHIVSCSFKPDYDRIEWANDEEMFNRWCEGTTGFPLVDAGMRELNQTGTMHNRVRMVVASFLTKLLLIDWRWGEAYFARKLMDFELSSNNGNWQWAAGTGCDAAPFFRIFSPEQQQFRFDPDEVYIRKWIPEYGTANYPNPIIDIREARDRTLEAYKQALDHVS
ncbi:MAG: deoxyribodipyrimidine photo-lyase [Bacteroidota bacterium]|nr:deoxyribodipyrimidine photo-lyase [Bacteroidota bacterium]